MKYPKSYVLFLIALAGSVLVAWNYQQRFSVPILFEQIFSFTLAVVGRHFLWSKQSLFVDTRPSRELQQMKTVLVFGEELEDQGQEVAQEKHILKMLASKEMSISFGVFSLWAFCSGWLRFNYFPQHWPNLSSSMIGWGFEAVCIYLLLNSAFLGHYLLLLSIATAGLLLSVSSHAEQNWPVLFAYAAFYFSALVLYRQIKGEILVVFDAQGNLQVEESRESARRAWFDILSVGFRRWLGPFLAFCILLTVLVMLFPDPKFGNMKSGNRVKSAFDASSQQRRKMAESLAKSILQDSTEQDSPLGDMNSRFENGADAGPESGPESAADSGAGANSQASRESTADSASVKEIPGAGKTPGDGLKGGTGSGGGDGQTNATLNTRPADTRTNHQNQQAGANDQAPRGGSREFGGGPSNQAPTAASGGSAAQDGRSGKASFDGDGVKFGGHGTLKDGAASGAGTSGGSTANGDGGNSRGGAGGANRGGAGENSRGGAGGADNSGKVADSNRVGSKNDSQGSGGLDAKMPSSDQPGANDLQNLQQRPSGESIARGASGDATAAGGNQKSNSSRGSPTVGKDSGADLSQGRTAPLSKRERMQRLTDKIEKALKFLTFLLGLAVGIAVLYFLFQFLMKVLTRAKPRVVEKIKPNKKDRAHLQKILAPLAKVQLTPEQEVIASYGVLLEIFEAVQFKRESHVTPQGFLEQVSVRFPQIKAFFSGTTETFSEVLYGQKTLQDSELVKFRRDLKHLFSFFGF